MTLCIGRPEVLDIYTKGVIFVFVEPSWTLTLYSTRHMKTKMMDYTSGYLGQDSLLFVHVSQYTEST